MDQRKVLLVIIAIILLLLISAGGYGTYHFRKQAQDLRSANTDLQNQIDVLKNQLDSSKETTTQSATSCVTLTDEEKATSADWTTYTNGTYHYTLKYPKDWTVNSTEPQRVTFSGTDSGEEISLQIGAEEAAATGFEDFTLVDSRDVKVNCESAKQVTYDEGDNKTLIAHTFTHSDTPFLLIYTFKDIGASYAGDIVAIENLILKTFQFSN